MREFEIAREGRETEGRTFLGVKLTEELGEDYETRNCAVRNKANR